MMRDVVFFTSAQPKEPEFQYALRSLAMIPHGTVWLVGGKPHWVRNVEHVPYPEGEKWQDLTDKWHKLRELPLSDEFIYSEDDYFILKPCTDIPNYTFPWQRLKDRCGSGDYNSTHTNTYKILKEHLHRVDMPSFDVHIPMVVERNLIPYHLDPGGIPLRYRTLIGNTASRLPVPIEMDPKARNTRQVAEIRRLDLGFLSSSPASFEEANLGDLLRNLFPDPSPYEVPA